MKTIVDCGRQVFLIKPELFARYESGELTLAQIEWLSSQVFPPSPKVQTVLKERYRNLDMVGIIFENHAKPIETLEGAK